MSVCFTEALKKAIKEGVRAGQNIVREAKIARKTAQEQKIANERLMARTAELRAEAVRKAKAAKAEAKAEQKARVEAFAQERKAKAELLKTILHDLKAIETKARAEAKAKIEAEKPEYASFATNQGFGFRAKISPAALALLERAKAKVNAMMTAWIRAAKNSRLKKIVENGAPLAVLTVPLQAIMDERIPSAYRDATRDRGLSVGIAPWVDKPIFARA